MDTMDAQAWGIVVGVVILALIAIAALLVYQKRQSHRLEQRFGSEYRRAVNDLGSKTKAESELRAREKRVEKLAILPLAPADAERFAQAWKALQGRFVDKKPAFTDVADDRLAKEVAKELGYKVQ